MLDCVIINGILHTEKCGCDACHAFRKAKSIENYRERMRQLEEQAFNSRWQGILIPLS